MPIVASVMEAKEACCAQPTESMESAPACPACGRPGQEVPALIVKSLARREAKPRVGPGPYFLCENADCDTVYYDLESHGLRRDELRTRVGYKERSPDRLVCYCLRVTEQDILAEVAEKQCCTSLEQVEQATGARTGKACNYTNPTGACCGPEVRAVINKGLVAAGRADLVLAETPEQLASDRACCGEDACCPSGVES